MPRDTLYIIGFCAAVCGVCSVIVSGAAVSLKERQSENAVLDRQKKVLGVAGLLSDDETLAPDEVRQRFADNIEAEVITLADGTVAADIEAAGFDQQKATKDPATSRKAPANKAQVARVPEHALIYRVMNDGEMTALILPVEGKGLWSTLYGYIALEPDLNTIKGLTFYKHGETPGLGGEVDNPRWKALWPGRKAFGEDLTTPAIEVIKGTAGSVEEAPHEVDGLSGATLTSRGVSNLLGFWLGQQGFGPLLSNLRSENS